MLKSTVTEKSKNTVVYRRKADEIYCEASLNDDVARTGLSSLFDNLANNRQIEYRPLQNKEKHEEEKFEEAEAEITDTNSNPPKEEKSEKVAPDSPLSMPHLNDVEMNINCSEGEWMVIYAFYLSEFAKRTFTKNAVYERYMAKRKTELRVKNFSSYWKSLFKHYFSTVNQTEIKFKPEKIGEIKQLIQGQKKGSAKGSTPIKKQSKNEKDALSTQKDNSNVGRPSAKKSSSQPSYSIVSNLNLNPKGKPSLKEIYASYKTDKMPETILIIVYYMERTLEEQNINENKIYTCLKNIEKPTPNLNRALSNIKSRQGWLNTSNYSDIKVSLAGENYIEHEMPKIK